MSDRTKNHFPGVDPEQATSHADSPAIHRDALASIEARLWRLTLLVLVILAFGLAFISWQQLAPAEWKALPVGLVVLVALFGVYVGSKFREMSNLRGMQRKLDQRAMPPPDLGQFEKLFGMVERSQRGYRDLIDTFDDLLFSISMDGEILAANRSVSHLLGHPFGDLMGRPLDSFVDITDGAGRAAVQSALPRLMEHRHWSGVLRVQLKKDGSHRFFHCTVNVLARDGHDQKLCVLARDITEERESEARFTELFETLQEGVYLATPEGNLENINPAMMKILGYEQREDLIGRPLSELLLLPEQWEEEKRQLADSDAIKGYEVTLRRRDGSAITCLHAAALIRDTRGRVRRHQGTLMDISERRAIEQRLHREEEFARRLVESFPDLVVAVDPQCRYTFVSPLVKELLGFEPAEMIGTPLGQRMDINDRKEVRALLEEILAGRRSNGVIEYLTERKDGEMRRFRASASPLLDASGRIEGVIASARDITEAKRIEQQLIQTERLAAMGQMIAGVAHELNNPLTAVLGVTELLRESAKEDVTRRQLDLAHRQARRAAQIVQNLLSFSRPPQPRKTCLQISDLVQRSLQLHEHSLRSNRIVVDFMPQPNLPAVLGDANQLTQVFLNLITNAEQAILENSDHGTLRIHVGSSGGRVAITFQDDGIGIRREILPRIFDPFFTTKRPGRGTGLGLSICLAILREHNGLIEAQPLPDGGALFIVSLPIATGTETILASPSGATSRSELVVTPASRLSGCSVLVVDDEESIRELVRDGLGVRGVHVDDVATGAEALARLQRGVYEAVLCDLNLSGSSNAISGRELCTRILDGTAGKPGAPKPCFLFMTGELVDRTLAEQLAQGGTRTLQKPFRIAELVAVLTDALAGVTSSVQQIK